MRYLVTGGAGFIGANLVREILAAGHEVAVVDDLSAGKRANVPPEAVLHELDVVDTAALATVCRGSEVIIHLAALPRVQFSIEQPFAAQRANVDGTLSVLEAARQAGVQRVVFASSSSVYGDQVGPLYEALPCLPKSPYALHKLMGEHLLRLWHELHGIETVAIRPFNVYGSYMDPEGAYALVIPKFLQLRKDGRPLTITGDGTNSRDFTHVADLVRAFLCASESPQVGKAEVINIGAGRNVSINDLAALIGGPVEYIAARVEPQQTLADTTRAKELLGWEPTISLEDGLAKLKTEWGLT